MSELREIIAAMRAGALRKERLALATLLRVQGSSYRRPGARLLIGPEGARVGSLSGGCLELEVVQRAHEVLAAGNPRLVTYDLRSEAEALWGYGLGCEGAVEVLMEPLPIGTMPEWLETVSACLAERREATLATVVAPEHGGGLPLGYRLLLDDPADLALDPRAVVLEPILPPWALWIFGAGQDARPLTALAHGAGFQVGVVDHRSAQAATTRLPYADRVELRSPQQGLAGLDLDRRSAAVLLSHNFHRDLGWLEHLWCTPVPYVGLLGSRRRTERLLAELRRRGCALDGEALRRLYAPVGLDIGADSPEEIALAIVAEVAAVLAGRAGGHLRNRREPLHALVQAQGESSWQRAVVS